LLLEPRICAVAFFLNGLIGARLHKNRHKSFSQLAGGAGEHEREAPDSSGGIEQKIHDNSEIARSVIKFMYLAVLTAVVIAHLGQSWWAITGAAVASCLVSLVLAFTAVGKARPS
jgi:hypothetical protein